MSDHRIGAGGWEYFEVPGMDNLKAYSKAFDFVEVNSTFYHTPPVEVVRSWASRVPRDFQFSIRCHRDLTHRYMLAPVDESIRLLETGRDICRRLDSRLLVLETPRSFDPNKAVKDIRDLLSLVELRDVRLVWEIRHGPPGYELVNLMQDYNMVHCVDLSRVPGPAFGSDILYSRLFGHGPHNIYQFDDHELLEIDSRARAGSPGSVYLSFHGGRMYTDAARLKVYQKAGRFPRVTRHTGIAALGEVLAEDARFPMTRLELITSQGWKVVDMPGNERVHAWVLLEKLEEKLYSDINEVTEHLGNEFQQE